MTIGVGFLCSDGVVLCADRQMTMSGGAKYEDTKILHSQSSNDGAFAFCFAGDPDAAQMMVEKARVAIWEGIAKHKEEFMEAACAKGILQKVFDNKHTKGLQTLFGIVAYNRKLLIKTNERKVVDGGDAYYIGVGDSSALRYLCDFLLPSGLNVGEAYILGAYIVSVANRFIEGCGGSVDHATLPLDQQLVFGSGGPWPNQRERYLYCEQEIGRGLRQLLFSGGTMAIEVVKPKSEQ